MWCTNCVWMLLNEPNMKVYTHILAPRGHAPFGQQQESRPLDRSSEIPVLIGFANTIEWDWNQSDLSDLTLSTHRVTESPWIADFWCWSWPVEERGLWGREWACKTSQYGNISQLLIWINSKFQKNRHYAWMRSFLLRSFSYHLMKQLRSCKNQWSCWKKNLKDLKDKVSVL